MILIGISGKIGCGKSTLATCLQRRLPGAAVVSFGGAIKDEAADYFGFDRALCDTAEGKRTIVALTAVRAREFGKNEARVRELIQWMGAHRRAENPDYWLWRMVHVLDDLQLAQVPAAIVDDVRMPEEARLVLGRRHGQLYRLDPYPGWEPGPDANDITETALDDWARWTDRYAPGLGELDAVADCIAAMVGIQ